MPSISYGSSAYQRTTGNFPPLRLINMFLEQAPTSENQSALLSRPGLVTDYTIGAGPCRGMFCKPGHLSGDRFVVSDDTLFQNTSSRGVLNGTDVERSMAASSTEIVIASNATPESWNGTNLADIVFPDTANVKAVAFIGGLFVFVRSSTQKYYWSAPLDGRTVDALDFASAEREEDQLLDVKALGDNLWLFGQGTIECHAHTGDATLPFTRIEQVSFDKGIWNTHCVVPADNSLFFLGSDGVVYRIGEVPQRISDHSIEQRIVDGGGTPGTDSGSARLFTFKWQGHEFVCIRLSSETLAYDCATQQWCEFQTSGGNWIANNALMDDNTAYFGNSSDGKVMKFTTTWQDLSVADSVERRFTAAVQLDKPLTINSLRLWHNAGNSETVQMRFSRDAGDSFSSYSSVAVGTPNRGTATWRRLGQFDHPGAMFEFKVTTNTGFRVSAVKINEFTGGRSRS